MAKQSKAPRVLIVVEGGVVQSVVSDKPIMYLVKDFDNIKECGEEFDPHAFSQADKVCRTPAAFIAQVKAD